MVWRNYFLVELARDWFAWILYHSVLGCVAASHCKFNSGRGVIHKTVIDICKYVIFRRAWRCYEGPISRETAQFMMENVYDWFVEKEWIRRENVADLFSFGKQPSYHCIFIQLKVRTLDGELVAMLTVGTLCTLCLNLGFLTILFFFSQLLRERVITCSFIYRRHIMHLFAFINIYFLLLPHLTPHMFS